MNVDASNTDLNSHICFNALATLQNIKNVENSCNFCSSSDHTTYMCPVLSQGEHVKDTSIENLSRSSVPHGLRVYENETGLHIISVQKFAKGCRFGPLMAPKSYIPIENAKFPLTIFGAVNVDMNGMPEFKDLFKIRHIHLDTRNEKHCNWMIHVDPAQYLNEQNLIAYEEDNEIFFAAIEDLDVGDILKVWYSPKYGECMKMPQLMESLHPITKNILNRSGVLNDVQWINSYYESQPVNKTEILLPSIKTIIKPTSYVCYENRPYESSTVNYPIANDYTTFQNGTDPSNANTILNLDDTISISTQFNELIAYDDDDVEQFGKLLNTSNEIIAQDAMSYSSSVEKKCYPCKLCDKKYSTMTNIYRHVRAQHNYFLCSLCMNMFEFDTELKEHIHKCPKSDDKKPQCIVCMQYFSNSWSLTRHLKIHVAAGECDAEILSDKKLKETKKTKDDTKDSIDLSDIDKNSQDSFGADFMTLTTEPLIAAGTTFVPSLCEIDVATVMPIMVTETISEPMQSIPIEKIENINADVMASNSDKDIEISTCIVCNKNFKSKSCMNKHLRSVHTVRIVTAGVKRSSSQSSQTKGATIKRSHMNENQASITHTGSPVNPMTAKALASKLNERNSLVKKAKEQQAQIGSPVNKLNDVPVPPLVSIQGTSSSGVNRDSENFQRNNIPNINGDHSIPLKNRNSDDLNVTAKSFAKKCKVQSASMADEAKVTTTSQGVVTEKMHGCDSCGKKFNKKYELKRHKTVHENVIYTCPYCSKAVKRKQSIMKHLKITHKDLEHIWSSDNFVAKLKQHKIESDTLEQSENSNMDEKNDDSNADGITNGKFLFIEHLDSIQNGNNITIDAKDSTVTVVDYINAKQSIDNNNYAAFIENNISTADLSGGEIYKNVFLSSNHIKSGNTNYVTTAPIAVSTLNGLHHIQVIGQSSEDDETILIESRDANQMLSNPKAQSSLNNIIDDCFFVDDALNCNVALNSPFSSDTDVDGFTMTNGTNDCVMNKELLNKFHDRLEEMDEKIDNADFKTIWNHMLDEDNLNDDIDDNEEAATDSVDECNETTDFNNVTAVK